MSLFFSVHLFCSYLTNDCFSFTSMGVDVNLLPQLAAETDPAERRRKVSITLSLVNCFAICL